MNVIKLIGKMRKVREEYELTSNEQALYLELIAICSEKNWKNVFQCSNFRLCSAINFSEKTLIKARRTLVNAGLIFYESGRANREESSYSFTTPFKSENSFMDVLARNLTPVPVPDTTPVPTPDVTPLPAPEYNEYIDINIPPLSPTECVRVRDPLLIPFDEIKQSLLADEFWKEQTAMLSGLSIMFITILPSQIDIFLQHIVAVGEENTIKTLSDAKRRFFWWWKNHGKNDYEKQTTTNQTIIW